MTAFIKVLYAQDDWVTNRGAQPEQVIEIDGIEYRSRDPLVIQCLFEGSGEGDTDALSIATEEWLYWVNHYLEHDPEVRSGFLQALGTEFPEIMEIYHREQAAGLL